MKEQNTLNLQLSRTRHTTVALQWGMGQMRSAFERAQGTMAQLRQANIVLLRFCRTRLQLQRTAVYGLEAHLRGEMGSGLPHPPFGPTQGSSM